MTGTLSKEESKRVINALIDQGVPEILGSLDGKVEGMLLENKQGIEMRIHPEVLQLRVKDTYRIFPDIQKLASLPLLIYGAKGRNIYVEVNENHELTGYKIVDWGLDLNWLEQETKKYSLQEIDELNVPETK